MGKKHKKGEGAEPSGRIEVAKGAKRKHPSREIAEALAIAIVLALFIRGFVVEAFKIPSSSMEDSLLIGDHLLVNKLSYGFQMPRPAMIKVLGLRVPFFETNLKRTWGEVERGDVIVFRYPKDRELNYIKRVIAVAGDKILIKKDRDVYVNNEKIDESYAVFKGRPKGHTSMDRGPYIIPEGHVYVLGDNRDRSNDSRYWGTVPVSNIRGKAFILYWSWKVEEEASGWGVRFSRIGDLIH